MKFAVQVEKLMCIAVHDAQRARATIAPRHNHVGFGIILPALREHHHCVRDAAYIVAEGRHI